MSDEKVLRFLESVLQYGKPFGLNVLIFGRTVERKGHAFRHYTINDYENECILSLANDTIVYLEDAVAQGALRTPHLRYVVSKPKAHGQDFIYLLDFKKSI